MQPTPQSSPTHATASPFPLRQVQKWFAHDDAPAHDRRRQKLLTLDAVGDSGASGHFLMSSARTFLHNVRPTVGHDRVRVSTAKDGTYMHSTHMGYIPHPTLPRPACKAFVFDEAAANLLSYVQIVRNGCDVHLTNEGATITDAASGKVLERAPLLANDKVFMHRWTLPSDEAGASSIQPAQVSSSSSSRPSPARHDGELAHTLIHNLPAVERARWWSDIFCGKPTTTILNAIRKGWLKSFPTLTVDLISKHLPYHSRATALGHLDKTRKGRASTKTTHKASTTSRSSAQSAPMDTDGDGDDDDDHSDDSDAPTIQVAFVSRDDLIKHAETMFIDEPATLRDLVDKTALSDCLIVVLNGYIKVEHTKGGTGAELARAFTAALDYFKLHGKKVSLTVLDNKCPQVLIDVFRARHIPFQKVPPYQKRVNRSERAMRPYKNAVISATAIAGPKFPMKKHSRDTAQHIEVILNITRPCGTDKNMSAWEWMHGAPYDFNRHPLLPIGMPVTVHDQSRTHPRSAWGNHGSPGHYAGPALDHYRCFTVIMDDTNKVRITSTLACHPRDIVLPGASRSDRLTATLQDLSKVLRELVDGRDIPDANPDQNKLVRQLHAIFTDRSSAHIEPTADNSQVIATSSHDRRGGSTVATAAITTTASSEGGGATTTATTAPTVGDRQTSGAQNTSNNTVPPTSEGGATTSSGTASPTSEGGAQRPTTPPPTATRPASAETAAAAPPPTARTTTADTSSPPLNEVQLSTAVSRGAQWPRGLQTPPPKTSATTHAPKSVRWADTTTDARPASPSPAPPTDSAPTPRRSSRHKKPSAKKAAAALHTVCCSSDAHSSEHTLLADAMLLAAADRTDAEAVQMRAEAEALTDRSQRAFLSFALIEMQANHALNTFTNTWNSLERDLRSQAHACRAMAIESADHVAALIRNPIDFEDINDYDDSEDATTLRELAPDTTLPSDGIAFGTVDDQTGQAINLRKESQPGHAHAPGWLQARIEEIDRLVVSTKCLVPMSLDERPREGATISYVAWAPSYKYDTDDNPLFRIRGAYGGNVLKNKYVGKTAAATASLPAFKILLNAVLSTRGAKFMTIDLKDMYLQSTLEQDEYVAIPVNEIPEASMTRHNLHDKVRNGRVYFRVPKAMYGLPQAGYVAQQDLGKLLRANGFYECPRTPQMFRHNTRDLTMSIVVDDFGVLYLKEADVHWLLDVLRTKYELKIDWSGTKYIGITLQWDYTARTCRLSMPDYVRKGVSRFLGESATPSVKHGPAQHKQFAFGRQAAPEQDDSTPLDKERTKRIQSIVGYFLYYARAVDSTMLVALGQISSSQAQPTENVEAACTHFLHYAATYPNATIVYRASDMVLRIITDASFHSEPAPKGACPGTRMGGVHYLGERHFNRLNGMIDTLCKLMDVVPASVAEAEYGSAFTNAKMGTETRHTLEDLGFPQPPTPIECDNQCAVGIANQDTKQKRSRAMDVRFHWLADRIKQGQFVIEWKAGNTNLADYFTKIHPAAHHRAMRFHFVCDKPLEGRTTSEMRRKKAPRNLTRQVANYVKYVYKSIADTVFRR